MDNDADKMDFICSKSGFLWTANDKENRNNNTRGLLSGLCRWEVKILWSFVEEYSYLLPQADGKHGVLSPQSYQHPTNC